MSIGEIIKIERKKKNLTQKQLANKINKSERMLQKYENNEVVPSIEVCQQISNILEISIDKILGVSATEKVEINSLEILYEFIDRYFTACGQIGKFNTLPFPEQAELAINIKALLDNKIDKINGAFSDPEENE